MCDVELDLGLGGGCQGADLFCENAQFLRSCRIETGRQAVTHHLVDRRQNVQQDKLAFLDCSDLVSKCRTRT